MSIEVTPDALAGAVAGFEFAYLLTLGDQPRPHVVAVRPTVVDGVVHVTGLGRSSRRNVEGNSAVTLLWPPRDPDGYTLIVDGDADRSGDDLVVTPGRAVLHRSAPDPQPVDDGACTADCVELPLSAGPSDAHTAV